MFISLDAHRHRTGPVGSDPLGPVFVGLVFVGLVPFGLALVIRGFSIEQAP
jgi:hypothetical protein